MFICFQCSTRYPVRVAYCLVCGTDGLVGIAPSRPAATMDSALHVVTAHDLAKREWNLISSESYPALRMLGGCLLAVYGPPGAGKSTMLAKLLDGLPGPVGLLAVEEGLGPAVSERLARLVIRREDFYVLAGGSIDDLSAEVRQKKIAALGIDSVTSSTMVVADMRRLIASCRLDVLAVTVQVTKELLPAGSNRLLHESDVVLAVEAGAWSIVKSRYQVACSGRVWEDNGQ